MTTLFGINSTEGDSITVNYTSVYSFVFYFFLPPCVKKVIKSKSQEVCSEFV